MKSTRRMGLFTNSNFAPCRTQRAPKTFPKAGLLESLESRLLLSTSASIVWNGVAQQAIAGEYVFGSTLGGNIQAKLTAAGLHVAGVRGLGLGFYQLYDYADSYQSVNAWANSHVGMVQNFGPNHAIKASAVPSELAGGNTNFWYYNNTGQIVTATAGDVSLGIPATQAGIPGADIDALRAWDLTTGSPNTVIAVLDTGINYNDPDLANRLYSNTRDPWTTPPIPGGDGADNDLDGVIDDFHGANFTGVGNAYDPFDGNGHGTLVSGLIAGQGNGGGPNVGVNWNGQILPVKVLDNTGAGTDASIIAGLNYVILLKTLRGVDITAINMSLGRQFIGPASGVGDPAIAAIFTAMDRASAVGIVVVVAAGNDGLNVDDTSIFPSSHANALLLSVAATDNRDRPTIFTNFGNHAELAAPGQTITGIGPDNGGSGTSFAAPLVTGAVGLLHSLVPTASPSRIVNAILQGVDVVPQLAGFVSTSGRLNLFKSLELLLGDVPVRAHVDVVNATTVSGWLYDGNVGAGAIYGQLLVDGKFVKTFLANQNRPDLINTLGSAGHGFTVTLPTLSGSSHTIQIVALDVVPDAHGNIRRVTGTGVVTNPHALNDTNSTFNIIPVFVPITEGGTTGGGGGGGVVISGNQPPIGFVDFADPSHIVGWAFDVQAGNLPVNVQVFIDGTLAATGVADQNRDDLTRLRLGSINHGFDILTPTNLSVGPHRVSVYALDSTTGRPTFIGSRTLLENAPLAYFVDNQPGSSTFTGYVYNPDNINTTVNLEIAIDGKSYAYFPIQANQFRGDVPVANQNHGFTITIPPLFGGTHFVSLTAYNPATGIKTVIAARNLGSDTPPFGSLAVNSRSISGFTYDIDTGTNNLYRVDVDGQPGNVFTAGTQGVANQSPPLPPTPNPTLPNIANNIFLDITQFGALPSAFGANGATGGDGQAPENTFAIQTAINNVSAAGGGTVYIGAGYWESDSLTLRSNVNLFLDVGAILALVQPRVATGNNRTPDGTFYTGGNQAFMHGSNITNFEISGSGTIYGLGSSYQAQAVHPTLVQLNASNRIEITGVEFANFSGNAIAFGSAFVNGKLTGSSEVTISDIVMDYRSLTNSAATAISTTSVGIVIEGNDFLVENSNRSLLLPVTSHVQTGFSTGGAAILISPADVPATNIEITGNTFSRGGGVAVGPNTVRGVDNLTIDNDVFSASTVAVGFTSRVGQGGVVQNVNVHDITLANSVVTAILVSATGNGNNNIPLFQNLVFRDFHNYPLPAPAGFAAGNVARVATITGLANEPIAGISFYAMDFAATRGLIFSNAIGVYVSPDVLPVLPANAVLTTVSPTFVGFGEDTHYYQIATPQLSAGIHTFDLFTFDAINGTPKLIRRATLLVPGLSSANTQPVGVITGADATGVTGYAIDPNTNAPINVEIQVDGVVVATQLANRHQDNLPIQFGPNHGFSLALPNLTNGRHVITVYAIDAADSSIRTLAGSSVVTKGNAPAAAIQLARGDFIIAKAFGFANFNPLNWVFRITVDGLTGNVIPASTLGPIVNGLATLAFKTPAVDPTRAHTISIEYIDPVTQDPVTLASSVLPATPGVIGAFTSANNFFITGYVYSTAMPEKSLTILVTSDNLPIRQVLANGNVGALGNHGFSFSTLGVPAGTHIVTAYAIDPQSGLYVAVASFTVTIPQP